MLAVVVVLYVMLFIYELVPLYKQQYWRDLSAVIVFGLLSFVLVMLLCFHIKLPSPAKPLKAMVTSITGK